MDKQTRAIIKSLKAQRARQAAALNRILRMTEGYSRVKVGSPEDHFICNIRTAAKGGLKGAGEEGLTRESG